MLFRSAVLAALVGSLTLWWTGCAAASPAASLTHPVAPAQQERPDPNAPYVVKPAPRPATPAASPAAMQQASPCDAGALKVQEIAGNVHDAYHSIKLGFRNRTGVACSVAGYPQVVLVDSHGQSLPGISVQQTSAAEVDAELAERRPGNAKPTQSVPANSTSTKPHRVVLLPKQVAAFQVVWSTGKNCSSVARLLVTAPGTTRAFTVSQPMSVCTRQIQLTPLSLDQGDD